MLALASFFGLERSRGSSRSKTIIPVVLKPGGLSKFGYHVDNSTRSRHIALLRGAREEGFVPLIARLNLTATFNKNQSPRTSKIFRKDQRWLSEYYRALKEHEDAVERRTRTVLGGGSSKLTAGSSTNGSNVRRQTSNLSDDDEDEDFTTTDEDDYY